MKTFMFPGQGSQKSGMGGDLFDEYANLTEQAGEILGYSIKELCLDDPRDELGRTEFAQPALYVVNALSYLRKIDDSGSKPDYVAGHSLGEYNALLAGGCFSFETGLKLVKKRGELMGKIAGGGMAAVINASEQAIRTILAEHQLNGIDVANFNTPSQIVISGPREEIQQAQPIFQQGKTMFYPLNTSGAFHSRHMEPLREEFESFLKRVQFAELQIPVIANVTARPYPNQEIPGILSRQITGAVRWCDGIEYLMKTAIDAGCAMEFEEVGHGKVLTGMIRKISRELADDLEAYRAASEKATPQPEPPPPVENPLPEVPLDARALVEEWNARHAIGTKVQSPLVGNVELETRTEAALLFGHRAVVYVKDHEGYFDLTEITCC